MDLSAICRILLLFLVTLGEGVIGCGRNSRYPIYYMNQLCRTNRTTISVTKPVKIELSQRRTYPGNTECAVLFEAGIGRKVHLQVSKISLRYSTTCNHDKLMIYSLDAAGRWSDRSGRLCGRSNVVKKYDGGTRRMAANFISGGSGGSISGGFEIIATPYFSTEGRTCSRPEWRCGSRPVCLSSDLVCDGVNNCFDGSDEWLSTCRNYGRCNLGCRLAIGIGTAVGLAILLMIGLLLACCCLGPISCALCGVACCENKKQRGYIITSTPTNGNGGNIVGTSSATAPNVKIVQLGFDRDAPPPYTTNTTSSPPYPAGTESSLPYPYGGSLPS